MSYIFFAILILTVSGRPAKSQVQADPAISVHNYKHKNKADKAKLSPDNTYMTLKATSDFVDGQQSDIKEHITPKYVKQKPNLMIQQKAPIVHNQINPHKASQNYKASRRIR